MFHLSWAVLRSTFICHMLSYTFINLIESEWITSKNSTEWKQVLPFRPSIDSSYVFISWLMVVIFNGSVFLERLAHSRCSGNHGGGRKKHPKTKIGRKWFRQNSVWIGLCPEDEWWAIYFAAFMLMLCCSILTFPQIDGTFSSTLWCTVGVSHVLSLASGTQYR